MTNQQQGSKGKGKEKAMQTHACVKINVSNNTMMLACMVVSGKEFSSLEFCVH